MNILSQKDPKWANKTIGTSTSTFANFGCLLTSIAMLADTTPDKIDDYLNSVDGYSQGDFVIWSKLVGIDGLLNEQKFPCIAKVDAPYMHFVVALDNENVIDPYYGEQANINKRYKEFKQLYPWTRKESMTEEQIENLIYHVQNPHWRGRHNDETPNDEYMRKEIREQYTAYKGGEEWVFAKPAQQWKDEDPQLKELTKRLSDLDTINAKMADANFKKVTDMEDTIKQLNDNHEKTLKDLDKTYLETVKQLDEATEKFTKSEGERLALEEEIKLRGQVVTQVEKKYTPKENLQALIKWATEWLWRKQ